MIRNHTQPFVHDTKKKYGSFLVLLISVLIIASPDIVNVIFFVPRSYIKTYLVTPIEDYLEEKKTV